MSNINKFFKNTNEQEFKNVSITTPTTIIIEHPREVLLSAYGVTTAAFKFSLLVLATLHEVCAHCITLCDSISNYFLNDSYFHEIYEQDPSLQWPEVTINIQSISDAFNTMLFIQHYLSLTLLIINQPEGQ